MSVYDDDMANAVGSRVRAYVADKGREKADQDWAILREFFRESDSGSEMLALASTDSDDFRRLDSAMLDRFRALARLAILECLLRNADENEGSGK